MANDSSNRERGRIGRTFYKTYCDCLYLTSDNDIKPLEYIIDGYYNDAQKAQAVIAKELGQTTVIVRGVTHTAFYASMSLEMFLKYADTIGEEEPIE